jgi:hypothetical protein
MAEKREQWVELARVIPWSDADHSPAKLMPETFRDEDGQPRSDIEPPELVPHVILQDLASPEKDTKVVKIPKREYDRIVKMLDTGELLPEELSHLPLRDLVPSLAEHLSEHGHARSGARRGVYFDREPVEAPEPNDGEAIA